MIEYNVIVNLMLQTTTLRLGTRMINTFQGTEGALACTAFVRESGGFVGDMFVVFGALRGGPILMYHRETHHAQYRLAGNPAHESWRPH
jgi:hypothetical protein